jgi:pimeloyl-ACP methyl ester carboxylesterase
MGRPVKGIAADSAARVVLLIPARNKGDVFQVSVTGATTPESLGGMYNLNDPGFGSNVQTSLNVRASYTDRRGNPWAIAVYRAPSDFIDRNDLSGGTAVMRSIQFQATVGNYEVDGSLNIVRPPVVLVHGLWDSPALWKNFLSDNNADPRFLEVDKVNYSVNLNGLIDPSSDCVFSGCSHFLATKVHQNGNQLGFAHNAPLVMSTIKTAIKNLRTKDPSNPVAVAQADVVAHSMGGVVTRQAEGLPEFADNSSFGIGSIHKLITVGTPHLGSPFATRLLQEQCMTFLKYLQGYIVFGEHVNRTDGQPTEHGAVFDMQGSPTGFGVGLSDALKQLNGRGGFGVPTHLIAGSMTTDNFNLRNTSLAAATPAFVCDTTNTLTLVMGRSPMATLMQTYSGWQQIFGNTPSDAIVSVASQFAGQSQGNNTDTFTGYIHSDGLVYAIDVPYIHMKVNFALFGPWEIDIPGGSKIPQRIIDLLQMPLSTTGVFQPIPH